MGEYGDLDYFLEKKGFGMVYALVLLGNNFLVFGVNESAILPRYRGFKRLTSSAASVYGQWSSAPP